MAFQSWTCALSREPIPSGFLDRDHGHITVVFPNGKGLRGLYSGYGAVLEPEALKADDNGHLHPFDEIPQQWLNEQGEVSVYHAWADCACQMDYQSLLDEGFDPHSMALEKATVFKTRNLPDGPIEAHFAQLSASQPCPYNGIFYGDDQRYREPVGGPVEPDSLTTTTDLDPEWEKTPASTPGMN